MKNSIIFFSCVCAIVLCSISFLSCAKYPLYRTFTVNSERIYIDEEQDVAVLIINSKGDGVEIMSDIPVHVIYALLEEKEEIILSNTHHNIYMYAKNNLK